MAEAHRNLALVLKVDRAKGLGATGLADLVGHHFADVTVGGHTRKMPGNAGGEPARAGGACVTGKLLGRWHVDVWGGHRARHCAAAGGAAPAATLHVYSLEPVTL